MYKGGASLKFLRIILEKIRTTVKVIVEIFNSLGCVFLFICVGSITLNITMRNLFNSPVNWAEELSVLTLVLLVYSSIPKIECYNDHLCMNVLYRVLPKKIRVILDLFRSLFTIAVFGYLAYIGYTLVIRNFASGIKTQVLGVPYGYIYGILPIMFTLIAICRFVDPFVTMRTKEEISQLKLADTKKEGEIKC